MKSKAFGKPIDYNSFVLLPSTVNARPGMRFASQKNPLKRGVQTSSPTISRLSAKAKSYVPKSEKKIQSESSSKVKSASISQSISQSEYTYFASEYDEYTYDMEEAEAIHYYHTHYISQ
mmetsp:Transcript_19188/g.28672  ORF Transcript_19188/g.28672 Transcript_19188/m.28672 type:complete len:119 (+) Transcript_19188:60-416(+)